MLKSCGFKIPRRYNFASLLFVVKAIDYACRTVISVTILAMAQEYQWNRIAQGLVLSSFFYGYGVFQVIGGYLSHAIGGKMVVMACVLLFSFFTAITPWAAHYGIGFVIACRVLFGMTQAPTASVIHSMVALWIPAVERSVVLPAIQGALQIGSILAAALGPYIIDTFGWPVAFYVFGSLGPIWAIFWFFLGHDCPTKDPHLSDDEWGVIKPHLPEHLRASRDSLRSASATNLSGGESDNESDENSILVGNTAAQPNRPIEIPERSVPWGQMLRSPPVWAILINFTCQAFAFFVLIMWLPSFFVAEYDIQMSDLNVFMFVTYFVQGVGTFGSGWMAKRFLQKGISTKSTRQIMQSLGLVVPGFIFLWFIFKTPNSIWVATILLSIALGFGALVSAGAIINNQDIAPRHSGVLLGIANTFGTFSAIFGNTLTGYLVQSYGSFTPMFVCMVAFAFVGTAVFLVFAEGTDQGF